MTCYRGPVVNLRPGGDHPERALVVVDLSRYSIDS
jgi:hypothetical protein